MNSVRVASIEAGFVWWNYRIVHRVHSRTIWLNLTIPSRSLRVMVGVNGTSTNAYSNAHRLQTSMISLMSELLGFCPVVYTNLDEDELQAYVIRNYQLSK